MPIFDRMTIEEWRRSSRASRYKAPETSPTLEQGEPTIPQNENPVADCNHTSSNSNGGIRRGTQASSDEDSLGLTGANQQPNEDGQRSTRVNEQSNKDNIKKRNERKVKYKSSNSYGGICRGTQALSDEDGQRLTGADQQPNEDGQRLTRGDEQSNEDKIKKRNERKVIKNRIALKVKVFDSTTSVLGIFSSLIAILFGHEYIGKCPANLYMPYMVFIIGLLSCFTMFHILVKTHSLPSEVVTRNFDCLGQNEREVIEWLFWLFVCLWTCEFGHFFCMSFNVSFDSSADNYCNHWFYTFTIIMNVFAFVGSIIGLALLYDRSNKFLNHLERGVANIPRGDHEWMLIDSSSDSE